MKRFFCLALLGLLSACATTGSPAPKRPSVGDIPLNRNFPSAPPVSAAGLSAVIGKDAAALKSMFGEPRLDVQEAVGRKLQFAGKPCVLDAYLYAEKNGGKEVVTHVDARRSDGAEVDRASCVDALKRR